jgi:hypothetical protein
VRFIVCNVTSLSVSWLFNLKISTRKVRDSAVFLVKIFIPWGGNVRYAARRSKTDRNGHKHSVRPVSTRFLLNYEAKRWSKANFFDINEIAIFRRSWRYRWFAPRRWNRREITGFTPPRSNTSLSFSFEVGPGQSGSDPHSVLSRFQRRGPVTYVLFSLQPPPCTELLFELLNRQNVSSPAFLIAEEGAVLSRTLVVVRIAPSVGLGLLIRR